MHLRPLLVIKLNFRVENVRLQQFIYLDSMLQ